MLFPARRKVPRLSAQIDVRWAPIRHVLGQMVLLVPRVVELADHLAVYFKSQRVVLAVVQALHVEGEADLGKLGVLLFILHPHSKSTPVSRPELTPPGRMSATGAADGRDVDT